MSPTTGHQVLVWDSGEVRSNRTLNVPYGGTRGIGAAVPTPLASDTVWHWQTSTSLSGPVSRGSQQLYPYIPGMPPNTRRLYLVPIHAGSFSLSFSLFLPLSLSLFLFISVCVSLSLLSFFLSSQHNKRRLKRKEGRVRGVGRNWVSSNEGVGSALRI